MVDETEENDQMNNTKDVETSQGSLERDNSSALDFHEDIENLE